MLASAQVEASAPVQAADSKFTFNVSEASMSDAVLAVGRLSRTNIIYDPKDLANIVAHPVRGAMTTEAALNLLIQGHAIRVRKIGPNSYLLKAAKGRSL
jgi:hypothetical protein